jgi:hypothetical protein
MRRSSFVYSSRNVDRRPRRPLCFRQYVPGKKHTPPLSIKPARRSEGRRRDWGGSRKMEHVDAEQ